MRTLLRSLMIIALVACLCAGSAEALQSDFTSVQIGYASSNSSSWVDLNQSTLSPVPILSGPSGAEVDVLTGTNGFNRISSFLSAYGGVGSDSLVTGGFAPITRLNITADPPGNGSSNGYGNSNGGRTAVPIPGSFLLFAAGFAGFVAWHRRCGDSVIQAPPVRSSAEPSVVLLYGC